MTPEEIETLDGRDLKLAIAEALGVTIVTYGGPKSRTGMRSDQPYCDYEVTQGTENDEEPDIIDICDDYPADPHAWYRVILRGVEEFGGITIGADMEEWAAGGLFQVRFFDYPACWFAPMGTAVCRAMLLAYYASKGELECH